jgi:hypothetical protein
MKGKKMLLLCSTLRLKSHKRSNIHTHYCGRKKDYSQRRIGLILNMKWLTYSLRAVFFIATVVMLVHLNEKADNNTESIVEFKLKMIEKVRTDSLNNKQKADLLVKETTKFIDNSSHVKKGFQNLIVLLIVWGLFEVVIFLSMTKGRS